MYNTFFGEVGKYVDKRNFAPNSRQTRYVKGMS